METINYSKSIVLKVTTVDNELTVSLNQDVPGGSKFAEIYNRSVSGFATGVNDTIDFTKTMAGLGDSAVLTAVASNFAGGGQVTFDVIADGKSAFKKDQNFKEYSSQQWAVAIEKI
ncbi:hypothetical protein [Kordia jejudonensis]|uniref:hypothetical protein n=1 Tax=Kordia jejudonensis TaxID=1348245 RepID=UPI0006299455|nr:hypothetical protein [Kordia jejudonensis]